MRIFSKIYKYQQQNYDINYLVKQKELIENEHRKICDMMNHIYEKNKNMPIVYKFDLMINKTFKIILINL